MQKLNINSFWLMLVQSLEFQEHYWLDVGTLFVKMVRKSRHHDQMESMFGVCSKPINLVHANV